MTSNKNSGLKVKNTFLEYPEETDGTTRTRRTRSDIHEQTIFPSPLGGTAKSPFASPILQPVDETMQALPGDDVDFELVEEGHRGRGLSSMLGTRSRAGTEDGLLGQARHEPAYVVPTTPSPFLHSFPAPHVVPPFGFGYGIPDMGLPPAYGNENEICQDDMYGVSEFGNLYDAQYMQDTMESQYMAAVPYMQAEMYNQNFQNFMAYGWNSVPRDESFVYQDAPPNALQQSATEVVLSEVFTPPPQPEEVPPPSVPVEVEPANQPEPVEHPKEGRRRKKGREATTPASQPSLQEIVPPAPGSVEVEAARETDLQERPKEGRRRKGKAREEREPQDKPDSKPKEGGEVKGREQRDNEKSDPKASGGGDKHVEKVENKVASGTKSSGAGETGGTEEKQEFTTVMLRNIPNKYTREMLITQLNTDFNGLYDFMYLPIDFKNKCNVGYGFINFRTPEVCERFIDSFHGVDVRQCLPGLNSKKIVEVTPARVQGLSENVRRLRNSPVMNQLVEHPEWMPLLFNEHGIEEPFPMPDQPLPPVKPRGRNREANREST